MVAIALFLFTSVLGITLAVVVASWAWADPRRRLAYVAAFPAVLVGAWSVLAVLWGAISWLHEPSWAGWWSVVTFAVVGAVSLWLARALVRWFVADGGRPVAHGPHQYTEHLPPTWPAHAGSDGDTPRTWIG